MSTRSELKFLNDVVKPWDELNALLVERYAFQPDLSDVTRLVAALAVAIKHQVDILALEKDVRPKKLQDEVNAESEAASLVSDVADASKHVVLGESSRRNKVFVAAMFEGNDGGHFRFIRNSVFVEHARFGRQDFMAKSLQAIFYWAQKLNLQTSWSGSILEAPAEFFPTAFLHYNPKYCINMASTRIMFFRRNTSGALEAYDPNNVSFEVR